MILKAPDFLGSSELGMSFVKLSFMESKNLHVSLGSVRIEIDHMQLLFITSVNILSLYVRMFFDIKNI